MSNLGTPDGVPQFIFVRILTNLRNVDPVLDVRASMAAEGPSVHAGPYVRKNTQDNAFDKLTV